MNDVQGDGDDDGGDGHLMQQLDLQGTNLTLKLHGGMPKVSAVILIDTLNRMNLCQLN